MSLYVNVDQAIELAKRANEVREALEGSGLTERLVEQGVEKIKEVYKEHIELEL